MYGTKSIGYATDLMIASFDGEVVRGDGYIAARTPSSPKFWWGNFVLFPDPPSDGDRQRWEATFDAEVGIVPGVRHRNLAWDTVHGERGDVEPFLAAGYQLTHDAFLLSHKPVRSRRHRHDVQVRPIATDGEWARVLEIALESLEPEQDTPSFHEFQRQQYARHQALTARGLGKWFGAFGQGEMVASMRLYVRDGVGRCQAVATAPSFRRQGSCGTLVYEVSSYGLRELGAEQIAIMTAPNGQAIRVYESVGFEVRERVTSLSLSGS